MIYVLMLLFALSLVLLINNPKNKLTYKFLLILLSFGLIIVTNLILSSRQFSYQYTGNPLYSLDYKISILLLSLKLNFYSLVRLSHLCYALYTVACMTFVISFLPKHHKKNMSLITLCICAVYLIIHMPQLNIWIYQSVHYHDHLSPTLLVLWNFAKNISTLLLCACLFSNNVILINDYRISNIWLHKWQISTYNLYLFSLNILFVLFSWQDMLWTDNIQKISLSLLSFSEYSLVFSSNTYIFLGIFILAISAFMIFSVFHYKTFGSIIKLRGFFLNKSAQKTKKQLRTYFHSFKNHLLTIQSLSEQGLNAETLREKNELLNSILTLSKSEMSDISAMLDSFNRLDLDESNDNIISCLESSIISANIPKNIRVIKQYNTNAKIVTFDYYYMTEMFKNIFTNAVDAINTANRSDGAITVSVGSDREILEISISDNGIGMDTKTRRRMFKPMFTTKVKKDYWGIGMFYAHKVISSHGGFIRVLSTPNKGTQISIFLSVKTKNKINQGA